MCWSFAVASNLPPKMKAHINHKCEYVAYVSECARTLARTHMLALVRGYVCILLMHDYVRMHSRTLAP